MGQCKKCKRKGLFLKVNNNDLCANCASKESVINIDKRLAAIKAENDRKDKDFNRQNAILRGIQDQYEKDKDFDKAIKAYESFFAKENVTWAYNRKMDLADLYQKRGRYDNSWGLYNKLILESPENLHRTRKAMFKQLKKEKRYPEALQMRVYQQYDTMCSYTVPTQDVCP